MKNLIIYLLALLALTLLKACNSSDPVPTTPETVSGIWEGKYGNGTKTPEFFWGFKIEANGTINELNSAGEQTGEGIWTKVGDKFISTYHDEIPYNATYSLRGSFNLSDGTMKGTWGFINNETNGGTFELTKKKSVGKR